MDVLCVGMYRACSTWQYEVATHLVEQYHRGQRLGFVQSADYGAMAPAGGWRVLKAHEGGPAFRAAIAAGRALVVYAIRDPRDVVYSMLHKRGQDFDSFVLQGMIHQILANDQFFLRARRPGAFVSQRYEQLVADPAEGVRELAAHLGIALTPRDCAAVADLYSFSSNLERAQAAATRMAALGLDPRDPSNAVCFDPHSLLHWNHLRRGTVGGWRNEATLRERAILHEVLGKWIADHGYEPDREASELHLSGADRLAMAKGRVACALRCAALRFPAFAGVAKRLLRIEATFEAKPIGQAPGHARDRAA